MAAMDRRASDGGAGVFKEIRTEAAAGPSRARRGSQTEYAERQHTALILDWDDTVFPTTWLREDCYLDPCKSVAVQLDDSPRRRSIEKLLARFGEVAEAFLQCAVTTANVFVVTLSRRPWVDRSSTSFVPGLRQVLQRSGVRIIYAQEFVPESMVAEYMHGDEFKAPEEVSEFWTRVKATAMTKALEDFHDSSEISWKNVISVGDSDFERHGMIAAGKDYIQRETGGSHTVAESGTLEGVSKDGHALKLRTKTVKLLDQPTAEELTAQLLLLQMWLPHIIRRDEGFDIQMGDTNDDEGLQRLHRLVTGEHAALSWATLAGVTADN